MDIKKIFFWGMILLSFPVFSQKYLLESAEQALDRKQFEQTLDLLSEKDSLINEATNQQQAFFYYLRGRAHSGLALSQTENRQENAEQAIRNFNLVKEIEQREMDSKFTEKSQPLLKRHLATLIDMAIEYNQNQRFADASRLFNSIYNLNKKDTLFLYYSASMAVKAEDYDFAESKYRQLVELQYNGSDTLFLATSIEGQKVESFGYDKNLQELGVKQQKYSNPSDYVETDKWAEINANLGLILFNKQNYSEAEAFLKEAFDKDNANLNVGLAVLELYQKTNRNMMYLTYAKKLMKAFPDNALLQYNIGVYYYNRQDFERAKRYFQNAIDNQFSSEKAYLMMANIALTEDAEITQKLNEQINKKYSEEYKKLYQQKTNIYETALNYLQHAAELNPENSDIQNLITDIQQFLKK
ncbi:MAG TPA: hypothetical protein VKY32_02105 [Flavobacterium sp.]|nr:hypothetical protein [Flavobacterium sp.]